MYRKAWRAAYGHFYWFLDGDLTPQCVAEHNDTFDEEHFASGNYFISKAVANIVARFADGYLRRK